MYQSQFLDMSKRKIRTSLQSLCNLSGSSDRATLLWQVTDPNTQEKRANGTVACQ
ncbi:hypothetical protein Bca4012_005782 [Brassica carinata]